LGSHHSCDSFENFAISAGSTVDPGAGGKFAEGLTCMAMAVRGSYRAVM
jgi:hypothetical protein